MPEPLVQSWGLKIVRIVIYKRADGIWEAERHFFGGGGEKLLDAPTLDDCLSFIKAEHFTNRDDKDEHRT